jgi:uncharacterized protein YdeI (YjbR/CyaY-like superfamily)
VGGGRHYLRVRNKICKAASIKEGNRVRVQVTVRDRTAEIAIPRDLKSVLQTKGLLENFKALPIGKKSFILRLIDKAAKPETRSKRIQDAVDAARKKKR